MRVFLFALFLSLMFLVSCNNHETKPSSSIASVSSKKVASSVIKKKSVSTSVPVHGNGVHHSSTPSKNPKKVMGVAPSAMKVQRDTTDMKSKMGAPMVKSSISDKKPKKVMGVAPSGMKVKRDTTGMKSKMGVATPMVKSSISGKNPKKVMGVAPSAMKVQRDTTDMKSKMGAPMVKSSISDKKPKKVMGVAPSAMKVKRDTTGMKSKMGVATPMVKSSISGKNSHHAILHVPVSSKNPSDLSHHRTKRAANMDMNMGMSMAKPQIIKKISNMKSKAKNVRANVLRGMRSIQNGRPLPFGIFAEQKNILSRKTKNE